MITSSGQRSPTPSKPFCLVHPSPYHDVRYTEAYNDARFRTQEYRHPSGQQTSRPFVSDVLGLTYPSGEQYSPQNTERSSNIGAYQNFDLLGNPYLHSLEKYTPRSHHDYLSDSAEKLVGGIEFREKWPWVRFYPAGGREPEKSVRGIARTYGGTSNCGRGFEEIGTSIGIIFLPFEQRFLGMGIGSLLK